MTGFTDNTTYGSLNVNVIQINDYGITAFPNGSKIKSPIHKRRTIWRQGSKRRQRSEGR